MALERDGALRSGRSCPRATARRPRAPRRRPAAGRTRRRRRALGDAGVRARRRSGRRPSAQSSSGVLVVRRLRRASGRATSIPTADADDQRRRPRSPTKTTRSSRGSVRRRRQVAVRRAGSRGAVPAGRVRRAPEDRAVGGAADDRVAALERRLRARGPPAPTRVASSVARAAASRARSGRGASAAAARSAAPRRSIAPSATRTARSRSSPTRSRSATSWARGSSRSSARRSTGQLAPDRVERPADRGARSDPRPGGTTPATRPDPARRAPPRPTASPPGRRPRSRRASRRPRGRRRVTTGSAMGDDRPDDPLVVERPEVLEGAAAAGEDRQLGRLVGAGRRDRSGSSQLLEPPERPDDALGRVLALDLARDEERRGSSASAGRARSRCRARRRRSGS